MKWVKWGAGLLALVAGLIASTPWSVPHLLKSPFATRASAFLGRPVSLGALAFNPWRIELTISDLSVGAQAGVAAAAAPGAAASQAARPLLVVDRLQINLSAMSLLRFAPVVDALDIAGLRLAIARIAPGRYDIDDLVAKLATPSVDDKAGPPPFALEQFHLHGGQILFDDRPLGRQHRIDKIDLNLPFLSDLAGLVDRPAEPRLVFDLDGAHFDSRAQATPFAADRHALLALRFADFDLAAWRGYLPEALPLRLAAGVASAELELHWQQAQRKAEQLSLRGALALRDLDLRTPEDRPLLSWRQARLALREIDPFARRVVVETLEVDGAKLQIERDAGGRIGLVAAALAPTPSEAASSPTAAVASAASAASASASASASAKASAAAGAASSAPVASPWQVHIAVFKLNDAGLHWHDASVRPAASAQLTAIELSLRDLKWPAAVAVPLSLSASLRGPGHTDAGKVMVDGNAGLNEARLTVAVDALSLAEAQSTLTPYFGTLSTATALPRLQGRLSANFGVDWSATPPKLQLAVDRAGLAGLSLRRAGASTDDFALQRLTISNGRIDALNRKVAIDRVEVAQGALAVERDDQGRVTFAGWPLLDYAVSPAAGASSGQGPVPARPVTVSGSGPAVVARSASQAPGHSPAASPASAWQIAVQQLQVDGSKVRLTDAAVPRGPGASQLELAAIRVVAKDLAWPAADKAMPLEFSARLNDPGSRQDAAIGVVDWKGELALAPLRANGRVHVVRLPLHWLAPYVATPIRVVNAEGGFDGSLSLQQSPSGLTLSAKGDALIGDVQLDAADADADGGDAAAGAGSADPLLSWQALALPGVNLTLKPGSPPQLVIGEASLTELDARLIVTEQGRFLLPGLSAPKASAASAVSASAPASAPGAAASAPLVFQVGGISLHRSRIDFSDHFVRPNYSAALTELEGHLGGFGSASRDMAALTLSGRAAGTAALAISGSVNPAVEPLALDIQARATDLELPPLSPYAAKYAGYAISRGKLSVDVKYRIDADGKLAASNQLILNQLTFGDRIDSPSATKLPVLFAVALLKDRHGVIDLNLPISGSVNDPQFSVGGIVVDLIVKLIVKAVTAPFALFSGGGSDQLSTVEFERGSAHIADSGQASLAKVAQALTDRPSLKMTVTGAADPAGERDAVQRGKLETRLQTEQRRGGLRAGSAATAASAASPMPQVSVVSAITSSPASSPASSTIVTPAISGAERSRLLQAVYRLTDLPAKPRNAVGWLVDVPAAQAEAMLLAQIKVSEADFRELALQRGLAVRDALIAKGLGSERLFVAAPRLRASAGEEGESDADPKWTPRVELSLSVD